MPSIGGLTNEQKSTSMRGRHFKEDIKVIVKWRTSGDFKLQSSEQSTFKQNLKEVKPENVFPLILNLISCFLVSHHTRPLARVS